MLNILNSIKSFAIKFKLYLIIGSIVAAVIGGMYWKITSLENKNAKLTADVQTRDNIIYDLNDTIQIQRTENESLKKLAKEQADLKEKVQREKEAVQTDLAELRRKYHEVDKHLNTYLPAKLAAFMQRTYGNQKGGASNHGTKAFVGKNTAPETVKVRLEGVYHLLGNYRYALSSCNNRLELIAMHQNRMLNQIKARSRDRPK